MADQLDTDVVHDLGAASEDQPAPPAGTADANELPANGSRLRLKNLGAEITLADMNRLFEARAAELVPADQPMLLIAQPTRSGGTLLSQLCDGHPQMHVHPYELEIGPTRGNSWPEIDLSAPPGRWFNLLKESHVTRSFRRGYQKGAEKGRTGERLPPPEVFPFLLVPGYQRGLFMALVEQRPPRTARDVFAAYFTSYFNAWLDNQNLAVMAKRWVVGFRSGLGTPENLEAFFRDYADGHHLSCVREPKGWIASRMRLWGDRTDRTLGGYIKLWIDFTEQRVAAKQLYGPSMFLCAFEDLVSDTETVMRAVSAWLEIDFDISLTVPTFNRRPIRANSSFEVAEHGVLSAPLDNWRRVLSESEAAEVDEQTAELHARTRQLADDELARW